MKKIIVLLPCILLIILVVCYISSSAGQLDKQRVSDQDVFNSSTTVQNFNATPIPNAQYIAHVKLHKWYRQLRELADDISDIIVGIPIRAKAHHLPVAKRMVFTYYQVQTLDSIKGDIPKGAKILLTVPGGHAMAENGTDIEVKMPKDWNNPAVGQAYVFFLKNKSRGPYQLVGGPQGLFEISPWSKNLSLTNLPDSLFGKTIIPQVIETHKLMQDYKGIGLDSFVQQIHLCK